MKKLFSTTVALAVMAIFISTAQAITISKASVKKGVAQVKGDGAAANSNISWESGNVTTAKNNGGFSFSGGVVPADCVGTLSDGVSTIDVPLEDCTPTPEPTGGVFKTGQTTSFATGDDGDLEKGIASPNPRFSVNVNAAADNGAGGGIAGNGICDGTETCNGTITDNLTGLIWLTDGSCLGQQTWANALAAANTLADGNVACGLSDGSVAGDWRLPNRNELTSLLDLGTSNPALPSGHPFTNFLSSGYWSSTTNAGGSGNAWVVNFIFGGVNFAGKASNNLFVIAVRGGS